MITLSLGSFGRVALPNGERASLYLPSGAEMARLDADTIEKGTPSIELMERAGAVVADFVGHQVLDRSRSNPHVVVCCGPGNNGGDGLVIARRLLAAGIRCSVVVTRATRYSPDFLEQARQLPEILIGGSRPDALNAFSQVRSISSGELNALLGSATSLVDALLGTGQRDAPRGDLASLIRAIRECQRENSDLKVIAVDIPTGVNPDTGAVYEPSIQADHTVCIELIKRGLMQFPARERCGEILSVSIGISERSGVEFSLAEREHVARFSRRSPNAHKGTQGRVLVIGGSAAMPGASSLVALGALRAGVGLVFRATKSAWTGAEVTPECMHVHVSGNTPHFVEEDCDELVEAISQADVVVVGPGLGRHRETGRFVQGCLNTIRLKGKRAVIDADALTLISSESISICGVEGIITPHPGEAATMLGTTTEVIQRDRFTAVRGLYDRFGVVSLLKGAGTLVWGETNGVVVARGTPYLATAGSGDILSGIVAECCVGGVDTYQAAVQGAYIHAVAGERATARTGGPIIASDIALAAASVIGDLQS